MLARFDEVFSKVKLNYKSKAYKLLVTLQRFTTTAFSFSVSEEQLTTMTNDAKSIINLCEFLHNLNIDKAKAKTRNAPGQENETIEEDNSTTEFSITPKLHSILHYPDLIRYYGPLGLFTAFKYERKHTFFKEAAKPSKNHLNLTQSLSIIHQSYLAVEHSAGGYSSINFYPPRPFFIDQNPILDQLPSDFDNKGLKDLGQEHCLRRISKNTIFRVIGRGSHCLNWFKPDLYHLGSDGSVIVEGYTFQLCRETSTVRMLQDYIPNENIKILKPLHDSVKKFVRIEHLHHKVDYIFFKPALGYVLLPGSH